MAATVVDIVVVVPSYSVFFFSLYFQWRFSHSGENAGSRTENPTILYNAYRSAVWVCISLMLWQNSGAILVTSVIWSRGWVAI